MSRELKTLIFNELKGLATAFGETDLGRLQLYTIRIQEMGYTVNDVKAVINNAVDVYSKFPTLIILLGDLRLNRAQRVTGNRDEKLKRDDEQYAIDQERLERLKLEFQEKFPNTKLMDYIKYWCNHIYGPHFVPTLKGWGLEPELWAMPALFDLEDAGWDFQKAAKVDNGKADH